MKKMSVLKRITSSFLALLLIVASVSAASVTVVAEDAMTMQFSSIEDYNNQTEFVINNMADWQAIWLQSNYGTNANAGGWGTDLTFKDKTVKLNVDIGGSQFAKVDILRLFKTFEGTFDGQGHTIQYVKSSWSAIIANGGQNCVIKNVNFKNCSVELGSGANNSSIVLGHAVMGNTATLQNVTVDSCSAVTTSEGFGLFVGYAQGSIILENCIAKNCTVIGKKNSALGIGVANSPVTMNRVQILDSTLSSSADDCGVLMGNLGGGSSLTASKVFVNGVTATSTGANVAMISSRLGNAVKLNLSDSVFSGFLVCDDATKVGSLIQRESDGAVADKLVIDSCVFDITQKKSDGTVVENAPLIADWKTTGATASINNCLTTEATWTVIAKVSGALTLNGVEVATGTENVTDDSILSVDAGSAFASVICDTDGFISNVNGQIAIGAVQDTVADSAELTANDTYAIRTIALTHSTVLDKVGISIVAKDPTTGNVIKSFDTEQCEIYDGILEYTYNGGKADTYSLRENGAKYGFAVIVSGIPAGTSYLFEITPHYTTAGGITVTGDTLTIAYGANGQLAADAAQ